MDKKELYKKVEDLDLFCLGIRKYVALSEVVYLIKQLDEPQKVVIPQYVADWIEYCKKHNFTLFGCLDPEKGFESLADETFEGDVRKCIRWCRKESNNFARAWLGGYEVEKEKLYEVKITASDQYLVKATDENFLGFLQSRLRTKFTKKELEKLGFGWVFSCEGVEVEEVEE